MSDKPKVHVDVFFRVFGETYPVGHGDVDHVHDMVEQAGHVSTLLHQLAWGYEEHAQRVAKGSVAGSELVDKPRIVINRAGDRFYEVEPDKFVAGMSYEDAEETFALFDASSPLWALKRAYPNLRVLTGEEE